MQYLSLTRIDSGAQCAPFAGTPGNARGEGSNFHRAVPYRCSHNSNTEEKRLLYGTLSPLARPNRGVMASRLTDMQGLEPRMPVLFLRRLFMTSVCKKRHLEL